MTQSRFFQICLFFPIVIWGLCLLIFTFFYKEGAAFILNNLYNAYRVFVPYVIFAAVLWKLSEGKSYRILVLLAAVVPVVWGAFFTLFYMLGNYVSQRLMETWYVLLIMAFWAVVVAYLVEAIPLLLLVIFKDDFKLTEDKQPKNRQLDQHPSLPKN